MKKVSENKEKKWTLNSWMIAVGALCVFCFFSGMLSTRITLETNLDKASKEDLSKIEKVFSILKNDWYYANQLENPSQWLTENAIAGMTSSDLDLHTNYFNLEQAKAFSQSLTGSNTGIGVSFYKDDNHNMVVKSVFMDSGADIAGIQPGDVITKIDDFNVADKEDKEIIEYIQGSDGKTLHFQGMRNGEAISFDVVPGDYNSSVSVRPYDGYGVVQVTTFGEQTGINFSKALQILKSQNINNLVLDLRGNSGGLVSSAQDVIASLIGPEQVIMQEKMADGTVNLFYSSKNYSKVDFDHIYVLMDGNTASASEVTIGSLLDYMKDQVTTIGSKTYGKGTEQRSIPFPDGTSLKYTTAEWLTPNGSSINGTGFTPDVAVEDGKASGIQYGKIEEGQSIAPDTVSLNGKAVQKLLKALGYGVDREDEYFSFTSSEELKKFQQSNGLDPTGAIDSKTLDALINQVSISANQGGDAADLCIQKAVELMKK